MTSAERYSKRRIIGSAVTAVLLLLLILFGRRVVEAPAEVLITGETMGTTYSIRIADAVPEDRFSDIQNRINALLEDVNAIFSTYKPDSELSRFNQSDGTQPFPLSADLRDVFDISLEVSRRSGGAFDVTVGPLVNAWGFGPDEPVQPPTDAELQPLRERVGYEKLRIENGALIKARPDVYCDLSAVAKGYGVDRTARELEALGFRNYMVEIGGEIRVCGTHQNGKPWRIAVERPVSDTRTVQRVVPLVDISMATSGDYRNFFEMEGRRYSHTIDPHTGRPVTHNLASVTVLHPECAWSDACATAIMVLGPEAGLAFALENDLPALLIVREDGGAFTEHATPAFQRLLGAAAE